MKSLHVVSTDARRGAETFAVDLAHELQTAGHDAEVVALCPSGSAAAHPIRALGRSRRSVRTLRSLRPAAVAADVVVAHGSSTLEACAVALAGSRVPFVYRTIGDPSYWVSGAWRRRGVGTMLRRAARHVVLWSGAASQLSALYRIPSTRVDVIPNGVPPSRFPAKQRCDGASARTRLGLPKQGVCLGVVGALSHEKQVDAAIRALRSVPDAVLVVAGDGPDRRQLERLAAEAAPHRVRFLGPVPDPHDVYAAVDLLLLPSRSEGMPAVLIEAGMVGTATVATAVGAIPDMLDDGVTGFLVPSGDAAMLARRIQTALPQAAAVGERASTVFRDRYAVDRVVGPWMRTLEQAAGA